MSESYYKIIDGVKYDRRMLEVADESTKRQGDGRISLADAQNLLAEVKDGGQYTDTEKTTMAFIRENYRFTDEADAWTREEIRRWAAGRIS